VQKDISPNLTKVGVDVVCFGSSSSGQKSSKMTVPFFIYLIGLVLKFKNFAKCAEFVRDNLLAQLQSKLSSAVAQLREGRGVAITDTTMALAKLRALCEHGCSQTTVQNVFTYYLRHQGAECIRLQHEGQLVLLEALIDLLGAALDSVPARILYADTTFRNAAKASSSYVKPPYVESISPSSGGFSGGLRLQIRGRRFGSSADDVVGVWLGSFKCTNVHYHTKAWIACDTPLVDVAELGLHSGGLCLLTLLIVYQLVPLYRSALR
jgi:hypothetical protein